MVLKLRLISSIIVAFALSLLYLAFFMPEIKRTEISKPISLKTLLENEM